MDRVRYKLLTYGEQDQMSCKLNGPKKLRDDLLDEVTTPYRKLLFSLATHPTSFEGCEDYKGEVALFSYGSGIIYKKRGSLFGITAAHVIKEGTQKFDTTLVTSFGPLVLKNIPIKLLPKHDLAVFCIDRLLPRHSNIASNLQEMPVLNSDMIDDVSDAVFMGYPGDLNEVAPDRGNPNLNPHSMNLKRSRMQVPDDIPVECPVLFKYPRRARLASATQRRFWRTTIKLPRPNGMSGGPVFHVSKDKSVALLGIISKLQTTMLSSEIVVTQIHAVEKYVLSKDVQSII